MKAFGFELSLRRTGQTLSPVGGSSAGSWWRPTVHEPYTGAWQKNDSTRADTLLSNPAVFACISRISQDISKLPVNLVTRTDDGVWELTTNSAYSPVLRRPNHYQTPSRFVEQWISSKLTYGNTYVLKRRDNRGVVDGLYVLPPANVAPLVAPDGSVYYELRRPDLDLTGAWPAGQTGSAVVGASEMIHDRWNCFFHPLIGLPPLFAAALAAQQGTTMQQMSLEFFGGGSQPTGVLMVPGKLAPGQAERIQSRWNTRPPGSVAIIEEGMKYEALSTTSVDNQYLEQLTWTTEQIAMVYAVPLFLLNSSKGAAYARNEPLIQLYHDEALAPLITGFESGMEGGLELSPPLGVEIDVDDLIWLDTDARTRAANETVRGGVLSPNEARFTYFGRKPVKGGDTPYMQQQQWPIEALADRPIEAMTTTVAPAPALEPVPNGE